MSDLTLRGPALRLVTYAAIYATERNLSLTITHGAFGSVRVQVEGFKPSSGVSNVVGGQPSIPRLGYMTERD
jgi:hypothetical protein